MKLAQSIKDNKGISVTILSIIVGIILFIIGAYIDSVKHKESLKQQIEINNANNLPTLDIDSLYFMNPHGASMEYGLLISKPLDFSKINYYPLLSLNLYSRIVNGDKKTNGIIKISVVNQDPTPILREVFLNGDINPKDSIRSRFIEEGEFSNIVMNPKDVFYDSIEVDFALDYTKSNVKYYFHCLYVYQTDAGAIYDIYHIRELKITDSANEEEKLYNPSKIYRGIKITNNKITTSKIYTVEEIKMISEISEKIRKSLKKQPKIVY